METPEDLVVVHLGASSSEAEIVRGLLEGAGIFALIPDKNSPLPGLDLTPFDGDYRPSGCEVLVAARDLDQARRLIAESRAVIDLPEDGAASGQDDDPDDMPRANGKNGEGI